MASIRFPLTVGAMYRKAMRNQLNKAKLDILEQCPNARVEVTENKSLIESEFEFFAGGLSDAEAKVIAKAFDEFFAKLQRSLND